LAALLCVAAAGVASAADWPQWLGPNRDRKSPDKGLLKSWPTDGPKLLWKNTGIGKGFSSPTIAGGQIFITGDEGADLILYALDMEGNTKWQTKVGTSWTRNHPGSRSSPVVDDGRVYIESGDGTVTCCDVRTGNKHWSTDIKQFGGRPHAWGYAESVLIHDDLAIVTPGGAQCMVALNKKTGKKVWSSSGFHAPANYSSPIAATFHGVTMIIQGTGGGIFAVNAKDGKTLWSNPWCQGNTANCPTPAYSDGYVFWANGYGKGGICLKLSADGGAVTATQAWTTSSMDCHHGGYVILDGHIYGNHGRGWACLDLKTGERKWSHGGVGKGSLCYADGMLYLFGENGGAAGLMTASPAKPEMKGQFRVAGSGPSWAQPVVIDGRLYLRYAENLYCFNVKAD